MKKVLSISLLVLLATSFEVLSQSRHYDSRSLSMGGGGTAYVDGYHANFINPANLMINSTKNRPKRSLGIVGGIGFRAGGTLINLDVYDQYLTQGLTLEGEVAEGFLTDLFGGTNSELTKSQSATFNIVPFGFSNRGNKSAFSLATRVRVTEKFTINRGFAEIGVYGLDPQELDNVTPFNFSFGAVAFSEISVGYARQVLSLPNLLFAKNVKLYAGVAPKYIIGIQNSTLDFNSTIEIQRATNSQYANRIIHNFDYRLNTVGNVSADLREFEAAFEQDNSVTAGDYLSGEYANVNASGFGLDMGATLEMDISGVPIIDGFFGSKKTLRVSMSVTDIGKITYDVNPTSFTANGTFDFTGAGNDDDPGDFYDDLADSLKNKVYGDFDAEDIDGVEYELPAMYNFGASLTMGKLTTSVDYGIGFNESGNNSKKSTLNLGLEYRLLGLIPLRVGTRIGGYSSTVYSAGAGIDLNFLELSAGLSIVGNDSENGGSVAAAFSGLVLRF
jgi:hypothetical protein|tara:strand:+ start:4330 stop:5835 length:1506 start_codon:yes stop_codon:yes gene_type:complete